jgi:hypothetical protein
MLDRVMIPLSAVSTRIVHHTDELRSALSSAAQEARESLVEQASTHPIVAETSLLEGRSATGYPEDTTVSHTVSVTAGGILISVLATASLALYLGDTTGDEW